MTMPARVAAIVAIGALILAGVAVIGGAGRADRRRPALRRRKRHQPRLRPDPPPSLTRIHLAAQRLPSRSRAHGPSRRPRSPGRTARRSCGGPDARRDPDDGSAVRRGRAAVRPARPPMSGSRRTAESADDSASATPSRVVEAIKIAGSTAYVDIDGSRRPAGRSLRAGRSSTPSRSSARGYVFTLDGNVDRAMLDAFLSTVQLSPRPSTPADADRTFTSPTYGYSIGIAADGRPRRGPRRGT